MTPTEFALWLNGALEVIGEENTPTKEQWDRVREKMGEVVGGIVANRLLERAEDLVRSEQSQAKMKQLRNTAMQQIAASMQARESKLLHSALTGGFAQVTLSDGIPLQAQSSKSRTRTKPFSSPFAISSSNNELK